MDHVGAVAVGEAVHAAVHRAARAARVARRERVGDVLRGGPQERRVEAGAHADELGLLDAEARVVLLDELEGLRAVHRVASRAADQSAFVAARIAPLWRRASPLLSSPLYQRLDIMLMAMHPIDQQSPRAPTGAGHCTVHTRNIDLYCTVEMEILVHIINTIQYYSSSSVENITVRVQCRENRHIMYSTVQYSTRLELDIQYCTRICIINQ